MTDGRLRAAGAVLALLGLGVAGYLTVIHYTGGNPVCLAGGGCESVQRSAYAELTGVPIALLGVLGYAGIGLTLVVERDVAIAAGALLGFVGFSFSAYLTYRELFTIHAVCAWCVASAVLMTGLAVVTAARVLRVQSPTAESVPR